MTIVDFIGSVGGLFGLCLGFRFAFQQKFLVLSFFRFSLISFFELLYWFLVRTARRSDPLTLSSPLLFSSLCSFSFSIWSWLWLCKCNRKLSLPYLIWTVPTDPAFLILSSSDGEIQGDKREDWEQEVFLLLQRQISTMTSRWRTSPKKALVHLTSLKKRSPCHERKLQVSVTAVGSQTAGASLTVSTSQTTVRSQTHPSSQTQLRYYILLRWCFMTTKLQVQTLVQ